MRPTRARCFRLRAPARATLGLVAFHLAGCGLFGAPSKGPPASSAPIAPGSPVELRETEGRPRLSLVERQGDPEAGVAMAIAHDLGSEASAALSELLVLRVQPEITVLDARAFGTGLTVQSLAATPAAAGAFVKATHAALTRPVTTDELSLLQRRLVTVGMTRWSSDAERSVGECSGELGAEKRWQPAAVTRERLEGWLRGVRGASTVAYATVGPRDTLEAAAAALGETPAWSAGAPLEDAWPSSDRFGQSPSAGRGATLSAAFRTPSAATALAAAARLSRGDSDLAARVAALAPDWSVERVVATTRPRGGCLRVDLRTTEVAPTPSSTEAASAAWLVMDESERVLRQVRASHWSLDGGVLRSTDPRDAAAVAAWRALSGTLDGSALRRFASFRAADADPSSENAFGVSLTTAMKTWRKPTVDVATRVEKGQGELWLLAASPCGTAGESSEDAGLAALSVRTLAHQAAARDVTIEPWVTPDGIGLLAHGPAVSSTESPEAHAARLASALGRALIAPAHQEAAAAVRGQILSQLDPDRDALTSVAFEALAPQHPSWLDPRGGWTQVSSLTSEATRIAAQRLTTATLRLGILANHDATQGRVAAATLSRWLRPRRTHDAPCPETQVLIARPGIYTVETRADGRGARAVVGVSVSGPAVRHAGEAEWTVYLLNRTDGWLERALTAPGLVSDARATVVGGRRAAAIVIEISAVDADPRPAVAQVRALLSRLADGALTAAEVEGAQRAFEAAERRAALDPRRRAVDTWAARPSLPPPTLQSLRRFHATAFGEARHVVVVSRAKP